MKPQPDLLDRLLDEIHPPPSVSLTSEVWRRIAGAREKRRSIPGPIGWREAFDAIFRQPAFAVVFIVACTLLGLFLAEMRVSRLHVERDVQLAQSYLRLIDPLLTGPQATASNVDPALNPPPS